MLKLLHLIVWFAMWVGISDALVHLVFDLKGSAIHAHQHGQISYEKFSRMLTSPEPSTLNSTLMKSHKTK